MWWSNLTKKDNVKTHENLSLYHSLTLAKPPKLVSYYNFTIWIQAGPVKHSNRRMRKCRQRACGCKSTNNWDRKGENAYNTQTKHSVWVLNSGPTPLLTVNARSSTKVPTFVTMYKKQWHHILCHRDFFYSNVGLIIKEMKEHTSIA